MSDVEKSHIVKGFQFEVGKLKSRDVKQQVVNVFSNVDPHLAEQIASAVGVEAPENAHGSDETKVSPALSQKNTVKKPDTRKVAVIAENGFDDEEIGQLTDALKASGMNAEVISHHQGVLKGANGKELQVDHTFLTADSVLFDAIYVAGGKESSQSLKSDTGVKGFLNEAFGHFKAIGAANEGIELLESAGIIKAGNEGQPVPGVIIVKDSGDLSPFTSDFINAVTEHRHWDREV